MCGMVRPESRHATALRGARSRFLDEPSHFSLNLLCLKRARENTGKVVLRKVYVLFRYRFYAETSHKGRQGKVVLRRVPVLFRYKFYAETSHWDEKKLTRYRAKAGPEVVLRRGSVLFAIRSMPNFLFIVSAVFSYGAFIS